MITQTRRSTFITDYKVFLISNKLINMINLNYITDISKNGKHLWTMNLRVAITMERRGLDSTADTFLDARNSLASAHCT